MGDVVRLEPGRRRKRSRDQNATATEQQGGRDNAATKGKARTKDKAQRKKSTGGNTLCRRGFHKWEIDNTRSFDVREGKLLTLRRCARCGETRTTLD